jgi:periplasmic protein TonB
MSTVPMHADDGSLKGPLFWSLLLHSAVVVSLAASTLISQRGDGWAGSAGGGAVSVKLVGGVPGIPLPRPEVMTPSRVVDNTKGLYKSEPPPKIETPPPDVKRIPEFSKLKPPRPVTQPSKALEAHTLPQPPRPVSRPSKVLEDNTPPPENAVPYGGGGAPSIPYSQAQAPAAQNQFTVSGATSGGLGFTGPGGGDFGGRYSWYVDAVRGRISGNWLQSTVDPSVRFAPRAVVTFDILRDGSVANVQVLRSSGNSSVDNSAVRAILSSNPLKELPPDFSGSKVSVEFWFDFKR